MYQTYAQLIKPNQRLVQTKPSFTKPNHTQSNKLDIIEFDVAKSAAQLLYGRVLVKYTYVFTNLSMTDRVHHLPDVVEKSAYNRLNICTVSSGAEEK